MKLYHGTSERVARLALVEGLKPRSESGHAGNWGETVPSCPDLVYLTTAYAPYFASQAAQKGERWAVIEIDTNKLRSCRLLPDEDFLEQATRGEEITAEIAAAFGDELLPGLDMNGRTEWFRNHLELFANSWPSSIEKLGNCAYLGTVPPEAITKIVLFAPRSNGMITLGMDPAITLLNYQICGAKYRATTRWFVGDPVTAREYLGFGPAECPMDDAAFWAWYPGPRDEIEKMLAKRDGLEFLKGAPR